MPVRRPRARDAVRFALLALLGTLAGGRAAGAADYHETFDGFTNPAPLEAAGWHLISGTNNPTAQSLVFPVNDASNVIEITTAVESGSKFSTGHVVIEHDFLDTDTGTFGRGDALIWTTGPVDEQGASAIDLYGAVMGVDFCSGTASEPGHLFHFAIRVGEQWFISESEYGGTTTAALAHGTAAPGPIDTMVVFLPMIVDPDYPFNPDSRLLVADVFARELLRSELAQVTAVGLYVMPGADAVPSRFDDFTISNYGVQARAAVGPPGTSVTAPMLSRAVPDPFASASRIEYALPAPGRARLTVHDVTGRRVATLVDDDQSAGAHAVTWRGVDDAGAALPSGRYFLRLEAGGRSDVRSVIRMR